jgi:hypothetical protein
LNNVAASAFGSEPIFASFTGAFLQPVLLVVIAAGAAYLIYRIFRSPQTPTQLNVDPTLPIPQEVSSLVDPNQEVSSLVDPNQEVSSLVDPNQEVSSLVDPNQEVSSLVDANLQPITMPTNSAEAPSQPRQNFIIHF